MSFKIHECDTCGPIWIILDASDYPSNVAKLALKVDHPIQALVTTAAVPHCRSTAVVSST